MQSRAVDPAISVVIPCFNEATVLPLLETRLIAALSRLSSKWEVIFVDDGSFDETFEVLAAMHAREPRIKVVALSRNFGHQNALWAGLHYAKGDVVAVLDADLQDPPELLATCLERWREGFDVIYAVRRSRKEGPLKRAAYASFYRLLKLIADVDIPLDSGDFCVMDRRVVQVLRQMGERNVFVRGMRAWAGFRQTGVAYEREARAAGTSKYPFGRLVRLAVDGMLSFSAFPLRIATWLGLAWVLLSFGSIVLVLIWRVLGFEWMGHNAQDVPGWASTVMIVLMVGGVQLLVLGIIGEYVGRIYEEVKLRPRWVVGRSLGVPERLGEAE